MYSSEAKKRGGLSISILELCGIINSLNNLVTVLKIVAAYSALPYDESLGSLVSDYCYLLPSLRHSDRDAVLYLIRVTSWRESSSAVE